MSNKENALEAVEQLLRIVESATSVGEFALEASPEIEARKVAGSYMTSYEPTGATRVTLTVELQA